MYFSDAGISSIMLDSDIEKQVPLRLTAGCGIFLALPLIFSKECSSACPSLFVRLLLRGLPGVFRYRHQLVFSWLLLMQIIAPGRNTLKQLARYTPLHIAEWHFRRLLSASY